MRGLLFWRMATPLSNLKKKTDGQVERLIWRQRIRASLLLTRFVRSLSGKLTPSLVKSAVAARVPRCLAGQDPALRVPQRVLCVARRVRHQVSGGSSFNTTSVGPSFRNFVVGLPRRLVRQLTRHAPRVMVGRMAIASSTRDPPVKELTYVDV